MTRFQLSSIRAWVRFTALLLVAGAAQTVSAQSATITIGNLTLKYCNTDYIGYCGLIKRPLDPTGAVAGTITIGFEYYPRSDTTQSSLGTFLPQEGGRTCGWAEFFRNLSEKVDHIDLSSTMRG